MPADAAAVRLLVMISNPTDHPPFDAEREWQALSSTLAPLLSRGALVVKRMADATENALKRELAAETWHILHFIGHGRTQQHAKYSALVLEGRDRRGRAVTSQCLGQILRAHGPLRLAVLQSPVGKVDVFALVPNALVEAGVPAAICAIHGAEPSFEFYAALAAGRPLGEAIAMARRWVAAHASREGAASLVIEPMAARSERDGAFPAPAAPSTGSDAAEDSGAIRAEAHRALEELERRRRAGEFDVFLCHNKADKPAVKKIAELLKERSILPWLDEWELRPGMPWQRILEEQIGLIASAAVFVGPEGIGPWQRQELDTFLREFVTRNCPVIPVLLPGAPREPKLPRFLESMTWVDFRVTDPDPLDQLIWGITGRRC